MKKYNGIILVTVFVYVCFALILPLVHMQKHNKESLEYKVEIHNIIKQCEEMYRLNQWNPAKIDLEKYVFINKISFLDSEASKDTEQLYTFYENKNGIHTCIQPFIVEDTVKGYLRFDYMLYSESNMELWILEGILFIIFVCIEILLFYIRTVIIKPFHEISRMPYELSKGHLQMDLEENKNRFFGKFMWGLSMLRDTLSDAKAKELKLMKEKKLLLLSISHDIKIPLSAIKLYAKTLKEDIYDTEEKRYTAAERIETHAKEIEDFVKEIVSASSEDIITIEVRKSEFYLKELVQKIKETYLPKAQVMLIEFKVGQYENKLLQGDMERAFEVIENLIENAFKYGDGKEIVIDFYEEDYCQIINVFNTGTVVPITEMPHLFDSFYRGSSVSDKPGNGLGLYISKQIMNKMDGEIFAERKENGMSFGVVFRE